MQNEINETVSGLSKFFGWEEDSEQPNTIRENLQRAYNKGLREGVDICEGVYHHLVVQHSCGDYYVAGQMAALKHVSDRLQAKEITL